MSKGGRRFEARRYILDLHLPSRPAFSPVWEGEAFRSSSRPMLVNPTAAVITLVYTEKA